MLISLVFWGFQLNIWTSVVLRKIWTLMCHEKRENEVNLVESFVLAFTGGRFSFGYGEISWNLVNLIFLVLLVSAYVVFLMSYISLKDMIKKQISTSDFGWKTTGIAGSWLITALILARTMDHLNFNSILNFDDFSSFLFFCKFYILASLKTAKIRDK